MLLRVGFGRRDAKGKQRDRVNGARGFWKRDLNPLLSEYKSDALPMSYSRVRVGSALLVTLEILLARPSVKTARYFSCKENRPPWA